MNGLIISDLHAGHLAGLTPPPWQVSGDGWRSKVRNVQQQCWNWFDKEVGTRKWDFIIANGDLVDGTGHRSGGSEQITTDTNVQAEIASYIIQRYMTKNTKLYITAGTPYHTGETSDVEALVAHDCNAAEFGGQIFVDADGVVFDCRHKIGSSGIPHGRATALKRTQLWNKIWSEAKEQPDADVVIRSHVHYHQAAYDPDFGWAMTTPALQGMGSKYGSRQCDGRVHFGFITCECKKGEFSWTPHIAKLNAHKSKLSKV
jgi:hypothetical protein